MTRADEPEQTSKPPTDDGDVSSPVDRTRADAADASGGLDATETSADPAIPAASAAAPDETSRPIDASQIADWLEDEARVSLSGGEPLETDGQELLKPGEKRVLSTIPAPPSESGRPVGAVSGGVLMRRMPVRTALGLAITGAAIGVAAIWARSSREHVDAAPASQAMPAASSTTEPARAPAAPSPRHIEDRSAGVAEPPATDQEPAAIAGEQENPIAPAEEPRADETAPRHPAKQTADNPRPIGVASKTMGKLYLVSRTPDVIVQFQGRSQRVPSVMTLPVGKQTIRVKRGDHEPIDLSIDVVAGRTTTLALD